ncbi:MAG: GNAT family N-acetyltransferase [Armatimonadota bacterium]
MHDIINSMDYIIRQAKIDDFDQLSEVFRELDHLHADALPQVFYRLDEQVRSRESIENAIESDNLIILVAECNGQIVGLINAANRESPAFPGMVRRKYTWIENIGIKSEFRGMGIGRALMKCVEDWSLELGCDRCELNVWEFNTGAIDFYEELGYEPASRRMWKKLK